MALAALIAAVREAEDGGGLIGTLAVAGRTLIERQARLAAQAGASHVVLLVERLPGALTGAIDRLRRDGINVDVARSSGDAADRFHPDERVMIFADGALAGAGVIGRLAGAVAPALLTVGEGGPAGPFERIDAAARWSGIALVSGDMLRRTVAMLGDWDLHSTLLRRAVGSSARRIDIADGVGTGDPDLVMLVRSRAGARAATQDSLDRGDVGEGWPARLIYGPMARLAVSAVLDRPLESRWLRWVAVALMLASILPLWRGWLLLGIGLAVIGALFEALGRLLATVRLSPASMDDRTNFLRELAGAAALIAFALHRLDAGWAPLSLAVSTIAVMVALRRERRLFARLSDGGHLPVWIADGDALVLTFGTFALAQCTIAGLVALALYAAASFGFVQHRLLSLATR